MTPDPGKETIAVLQHGEIIVKGKFLWGSNFTFLVEVEHEGMSLQAVYKPSRGERPLWDFPSASLAHREAAAYLVSEAMELGMIPETVYRRRGPVGAGSLQRFIEHDPENHYFNMQKTDLERLRPVALFDLVVNNADRKGGHVLLDGESHIWLIDHGLCFHVEDKLRTVIWDFCGQTIAPDLLEKLRSLQKQLQPEQDLFTELGRHLSGGEIRAMGRRISSMLENPVFPDPHPNRRPYPWPLL
jgi:hypothetical protein